MNTNMTLEEFATIYDKLEANQIILDVRTEDEYNEAKIPGSKNITHTEVQNHTDELKKYDKIYIYCRRGGRAKMATEVLSSLGLTNLVCIGDAGMDWWKEQGLPTA